MLLRELLTTRIVYSIFPDLIQIRARVFISKIEERSLENVYIFDTKSVNILVQGPPVRTHRNRENSQALQRKRLANSSYTKSIIPSILFAVIQCFGSGSSKAKKTTKKQKEKSRVFRCWKFSSKGWRPLLTSVA
jgi:hypothetical protein